MFCRGQIWLTFFGPAFHCTIGDLLSRLTAMRLGAESSKIKMAGQDGTYSTDVTLMTFANWLRRARAPTTLADKAQRDVFEISHRQVSSGKAWFSYVGKSQTIRNFTFCRPSQILPIYRIFARAGLFKARLS